MKYKSKGRGMKKLFKTIILLFAASFILTGCAFSRSELDLSEAISNDIQTAENEKTVIIDKYTDHRTFATNASTPDQPTYDPGEVFNDEVKSKLIGRKRNGYGKALGDVVLAKNLTTEKIVKNIVSKAFSDAGYSVVTEDPNNKAVHVNIDLDKFWSWVDLGFWTVGVQANINYSLELTYGNKSETINTYVVGEERSAIAVTPGLWKEAYLKTIDNSKKDLSKKIKKSEFLNNQ